MNALQYLQLSVQSLKERSIRTWITVFGIVVSIAVIFILFTLSAGLNNAVIELFEEFGTDRIYILGSNSNPTALDSKALTFKELEEIEKLPYFKAVIPGLAKQTIVEYRGTQVFTFINGLPNDKNTDLIREEYLFDEKLVAGQFWSQNERKVAVVGYDVAYNTEDFFGKELQVKNSITINGTKFRVIGIYEKTGSPQDDASIYLPLEDVQDLFNEYEEISYMDAIIKEGQDINQVEARLDRRLEKLRGEDNYIILTPQAILKQFNSITSIIQSLLLAIASISMLVGAIGIANTMFTAVLEREKEIGVMKSVGARNRDILQLFMMESGLIGLIGGIAGVILGIGISLAIGQIAIAAGFALLSISINPLYIVYSLLFAFIVGVISGAIPAYTASRKKIVDTLRDE